MCKKNRQKLSELGENYVIKQCGCPHCKKMRALVRLPLNFKCADIVCDFCGYLAQVKTTRVKNIASIPDRILGAAWDTQKERMDAAIYFPLFIVLINDLDAYSIYCLSADLQNREMFKPRKPLSATARRAGSQGFIIDTSIVKNYFVTLY
nr:DpnI domain-containing protein [uncultured Bartonella sp.]